MVTPIKDTYVEGTTFREITFRYDRNVPDDMVFIKKLVNLCVSDQPNCENCENYYREGEFCGYRAHMCKLNGCLDYYGHPHHDMDGSKCTDYKRKESKQ